MDIWSAYSEMKRQFVRWVGTNTEFSVKFMLGCIEREFAHRRKFPKSCSPGLLCEIREEYRMVKAVLRAYPDIDSFAARLHASYKTGS